MSDYELTVPQIQQLQQIFVRESQKPPAEQNWKEAYDLIASIIQNSNVSDGVKFFFQTAGDVNANSANSAANFFITDYYKYAASLQEVNLTDDQVRAVSGEIGTAVIRDIVNNGIVPESIKPIVDSDILQAVTNIPGVSQELSPATWGASLFAETKLGYDGFFDRYFTRPEDWQIFYNAASKACLDTGAGVLAGTLQSSENGQNFLTCVNVFGMAGLFAEQQVLAAEAQGTLLILNAIKAGLDAVWNLVFPPANGAELQKDLSAVDVFGSSSLVNGDVVVNLYAGDGWGSLPNSSGWKRKARGSRARR